MLDVIEWQSILNRTDNEDELATCPNCGALFKPRRKNMKFCQANCRKAFSKPTQNSLHSPTTARKNMELFQLARQMADVLYSLPPNRRLGHIQELISEARAGNTKLREVLSNWKLRHPHPEDDTYLFARGNRQYCTIAQAAQHYCKRFWRANVSDVVYCRVPEPPTGEVD